MLKQHGTQEQKDHFLPRMAPGEVRGAFSMSEPALGSDVSAITSKGVRDGDEYVLNGQKMWLTNGGTSTWSPCCAGVTKDTRRAPPRTSR